MSQNVLTTTREVITVLGGTSAVASLTKRRYSAAFNWLGFDTFPPNTYIVIKSALHERGYDAPDSLWRMTEREEA
jgi:hypothetical protein